uniref:Uncharacterized protein n=1 Tax=Anguilla anguilla TaxID=7936 RepID=A0A0E9VC25_ANGAN
MAFIYFNQTKTFQWALGSKPKFPPSLHQYGLYVSFEIMWHNDNNKRRLITEF